MPWNITFFSSNWSSSKLILVSSFFCLSSFCTNFFSILLLLIFVSPSNSIFWSSFNSFISCLMGAKRSSKPANICLLSSVSSGFKAICPSLFTPCLSVEWCLLSIVLSMWTLLLCAFMLSGGLMGRCLFFVVVELGVLDVLSFVALGVPRFLPVFFFLSVFSCLLT